MTDITAIIEIPAGSSTKYEMDKKSGRIQVDRFLHTAMHYPFNYGYITNTLAEDGDPIDVIVLSLGQITPGATIKIKVIGMLEMEDEAGIDTKLIAVPLAKIDPLYGQYNSIHDVPQALKNMIKHFFEHYKELEGGKWVKTKRWLDKPQADQALASALNRYQNK